MDKGIYSYIPAPASLSDRHIDEKQAIAGKINPISDSQSVTW